MNIHTVPGFKIFGRTCMLLVGLGLAVNASAERFIVQGGQPRAEIVMAAHPPRTVRLAAWELQNHVRTMSGATLPIVHEPADAAVSVYIGASEHTARLGITNEGLDAGAYRIVSGDDWLVLIGTDTDFEPIEPYTRWRSQRGSEAMLSAWDEMASGRWGHPAGNAFKMLLKNVDREFREEEQAEALNLWAYDERGSYNAVCGFLRRLGVRWYMPGDVGAVVPELDSIPLPDIDERAEPAFPVRDCNVRIGIHDRRLAIWAMRLGMRQPHGFGWAHGLNGVTSREEMKQDHPEYYAFLNGQRNTGYRSGGKQCLSSPGLFKETVRYARALFEHYKHPVVSVQPSDGYTTFCQCALCAGKNSPERLPRGSMSDYVWGFTARVANETAKTHPDRLIQNMAYNFAVLPPVDIDKLPDNVLVCMIGARQPTTVDPEERKAIRELRDAWKKKTNRKLVNFENYPHTARGHWLPSFTPHVNAASINAIKGDFLGEQINPDSHRFMEDVAFNSHPFYFTFRMYWGDKHQDIDPMLEEFYTLFYGPARTQMKAFYEYCEVHHPEMRHDQAKADRALALFAEARQQVAEGSLYDRRLALMGEYLEGLAARSAQLAKEQERRHAPELRMWRGGHAVTIDGALDDDFWQNVPYFAHARLHETQTGRTPGFGTRFKVAWGGNHLYFAIWCDEPYTNRLAAGSDRHDDPAILKGDCVELMIETEQKSFYHIGVGPTGAIVDLDREGGEETYLWDSQAEVATRVGDGVWTVEMRIPVTEDRNDPFHQVVGRRPLRSLPWYMNVCRRRPRKTGTETSAFSPTGEEDTLVTARFAKVYCK